MTFREKTTLFIATGANIGKIPFAPGTFGSAAGLLLCFFMSRISPASAAILVVTIILLAIWVSEYAERSLHAKDPGCIVIDEVAGMMITMIGLPFTVSTALLGFFLFRLFDILKPPPVRNIQDGLPGGAGIVLDDVAAGIISNIILRTFCHVAGI